MGGTSEEMALGKTTDPSGLPLSPVSSKLDQHTPALHGSSKIACNGFWALKQPTNRQNLQSKFDKLRNSLFMPKNLNCGYKLRSEQICQNNEGPPQEASAVQLNRQSPNIVQGKNRQTPQATKYCSF